MKYILKSLTLIFVSSQIYAQRVVPFFKSGEIVCFVGNSITTAGDFHHNILLYYVTRFPKIKVTFYNCGIAGDVTNQVISRMDSDILVHKPTTAVIMLGMNDVGRGFYPWRLTTNDDTLKKRRALLEDYHKNVEILVKSFLAKNIRVVLQKPSAYDQTAKIASINNYGVNDALKTCANYLQKIANKYHLQTIDYQTIMSNANHNLQIKDSSATIVGPDRIHPGPAGHLVMAYQFLKTTGALKYVSKIIIQKDLVSSRHLSYNCNLRKLVLGKDKITFDVLEGSLPFPTVDNQNQGLVVVPFTRDLNIELLRISDISSGIYKLMIDTIQVGRFTSDELKKGVNLTNLTNTPQYRQAMKVRNILVELWRNEVAIRNVRIIDFNFLNSIKNKQDLISVQHYLDSLANTNIIMKSRMTAYSSNKLKEGKMERISDTLRIQAYEAAQCPTRTFRLVVEK